MISGKKLCNQLSIFFNIIPALACAQWSADGYYTATTPGVYLYSPLASDEDVELSDMITFDFIEALSLDNNTGIQAIVDEGGQVELAIYSWDVTNNGLGAMIYEGYIDETATGDWHSFSIKTADENVYLDGADIAIQTSCETTDIACRAQEASVYIPQSCVVEGTNNWWKVFNYGFQNQSITCTPEYLSKQPVVVRLYVSNATAKLIKVPGLSSWKLQDYFHPPANYKLNCFAAINSYGCAGSNDQVEVADEMKGWNPDFIISMGNDSHHRDPSCGADFESNLGEYYMDFMEPGTGDFDRFYPVPGVWDYLASDGSILSSLSGETEWRTFFDKTTTETEHYDYVWGDFHFYALNSINQQSTTSTDPTAATSLVMSDWLKTKLAASTSKWNIVYMHHSPYASNGSHSVLQWDMDDWSVKPNIVITGDQGFYERHIINGVTYIVNGPGGAIPLDNTVATSDYLSSMVEGTHYSENHGMFLGMQVGPGRLPCFKFVDKGGDIIDSFYLFEDGTTLYEDKTIPELSEPNTNIDVFLMLGQSNMASRCDESNTSYGRCVFSDEERQPLENVYLYNQENKLIKTTNPINQFSTVDDLPSAFSALNVGWTFGPDVFAQTGTTVGLICNAKGGTYIEDWKKSRVMTEDEKENYFRNGMKKGSFQEQNIYYATVNRVKDLLTNSSYPNATLRAVLWQQGESDAATNQQYATDLKDIIESFRNDLESIDDTYGNIPWIIGELTENSTKFNGKAINDQLADIPGLVSNTAIVSSDGLTLNEDNIHFDRASQYTYGHRFGAAYLGMNAGSQISTLKEIESGELNNHNDFPKIQVFPNPTMESFTLRIDADEIGQVKVSVSDLKGKSIFNHSLNIPKEGNYVLNLNSSKWAVGSYVLKIVGPGISDSKTIVKK